MRVLDPEASEAAEVVRKFPPRKPKRSGEAADGRARDLASPGGNDEQDDEAGTADPVDPPTATDRDVLYSIGEQAHRQDRARLASKNAFSRPFAFLIEMIRHAASRPEPQRRLPIGRSI